MKKIFFTKVLVKGLLNNHLNLLTEVKEVKLEDGVLNVSLIQDLPEEKKEKTIKIS